MMRPFLVSDGSITKAQQNVLLQKSTGKNNLSIYPNPFAVSTIIQFDVTAQSMISIKLHNIEGREVSKVFEREKAVGVYKVAFNGSNLPAGIYISLMQINSQVLQRKLIIQR